jgi:hypothetical protein
MIQRAKTFSFLIVGAGLYFLLKTFIPFGGLILYPFQLLATILHEFGHASGTLLTGGNVNEIQINANGSGYCSSSGGWPLITLMGGYIGSALFGNVLIYVGLRHPNLSNYVLYALMAIMIGISTFWSASLVNTVIVALFAVGMYILSRLNSHVAAWALTFMGILVVLHILEDFSVGPSSDIAAFTQMLPILPFVGWMFVWLFAAGAITYWNVRSLLRD